MTVFPENPFEAGIPMPTKTDKQYDHHFPGTAQPAGCPAGLLKIIVLVFFSFFVKTGLQAQQDIDYAIHANIIYHFTKYIDWPDAQKKGDFIIGIVGETPLYDKLTKIITNKTVGNRKIIIQKYSSSAESFRCHILFIGHEAGNRLKTIIAGTGNDSVLLVSETEGFARKGTCINFIIVRERLKLEINKTAIEQRHLSIATELLNLGTIVK